MSEFKRFNVVPVLPDELSALTSISENLWYCWNHDAISLFRNIDPELWHNSNHNPVRVLKGVDQRRLNELAGDPEYLALLKKVENKIRKYISGSKNSGKNDHTVSASPEPGNIYTRIGKNVFKCGTGS